MKFHLHIRGTTSGGWRLFAGILIGAAFFLAVAALFLFFALGAAMIAFAGLIVAMIIVFRRVAGNARRPARARDDRLPPSTPTAMRPRLPHRVGGAQGRTSRRNHE